MNPELLNKLFLELSQVVTAKTAREKRLEDILKESNELLRSCHCVAERSGDDTNWSALREVLKKKLGEQYIEMYPETYLVPKE